MKLRSILTISALAGALATSSTIAQADRGRHGRHDRVTVRQRDTSPDVIGTARIRGSRGVAEFRLTPGERRDGLQIWTDANRLRVRSIELEYSDGRTVTFRGNVLRDGLVPGELLTIQRGRPAGLRVVRVAYVGGRDDRGSRLSLIQIHDGDGYTREGDRDFDSDHFDNSRDRRAGRY
jgi:hypothetical protein